MQVVRHDYTGEVPAGERERASVFEVDFDDLHTRIGPEIIDTRHITVDGDDVVASLEEEARVPSAAAREIEYRSCRGYERRETNDPRRGDSARVWLGRHDARSTLAVGQVRRTRVPGQ